MIDLHFCNRNGNTSVLAVLNTAHNDNASDNKKICADVVTTEIMKNLFFTQWKW